MKQPNIVVVDYEVGNTYSVLNAIQTLGYGRVKISSIQSDIFASDALILPGVGAFDACMKSLQSHSLDSILFEAVKIRHKPILGICVGMQLFATHSHEHGIHSGLNWIPGQVERLASSKDFLVPHVGWNDIKICNPTGIFSGLSSEPHFYFDHSFHFRCDDKFIVAQCQHGTSLAAAINYQNIHGVQFHPEKSQKNGLKLFRNFFDWVAQC